MNEPIHMRPREIQIMKLMGEGHEIKEIARLLNISPNTVKVHVFNLRERLQAKNIRQAITISIQRGYI